MRVVTGSPLTPTLSHGGEREKEAALLTFPWSLAKWVRVSVQVLRGLARPAYASRLSLGSGLLGTTDRRGSHGNGGLDVASAVYLLSALEDIDDLLQVVDVPGGVSVDHQHVGQLAGLQGADAVLGPAGPC